MILDNSKERKVHEWIEKYIEQGAIDIVTGYFTIATLGDFQQLSYHCSKMLTVQNKGERVWNFLPIY
jgi:hypothetical protein